jgi:uncharacterized protein (DUF1919 family)
MYPLLNNTGMGGAEKFGHLRGDYIGITFTGNRHKNAADQILPGFSEDIAVRRIYIKKATLRTELDDKILQRLDKVPVKTLRVCHDSRPLYELLKKMFPFIKKGNSIFTQDHLLQDY